MGGSVITGGVTGVGAGVFKTALVDCTDTPLWVSVIVGVLSPVATALISISSE